MIPQCWTQVGIPLLLTLCYHQRIPNAMQYAENYDEAVPSSMGTDPRMAPPAGGHASMEPDWSGAAASAAHVPLLPSDSLTGPVPRGLNSLNVDAIMDSRKKIGKGKKRKQ